LREIVNQVCLFTPQPCFVEELKFEIRRLVEISDLQLGLILKDMVNYELLKRIEDYKDIIMLQPTIKWVGVTNVALTYPDGLRTEELIKEAVGKFTSLSGHGVNRAGDEVRKMNTYSLLETQFISTLFF